MKPLKDISEIQKNIKRILLRINGIFLIYYLFQNYLYHIITMKMYLLESLLSIKVVFVK
jgi:hypothetical protein